MSFVFIYFFAESIKMYFDTSYKNVFLVDKNNGEAWQTKSIEHKQTQKHTKVKNFLQFLLDFHKTCPENAL